jgi:ABC-type branched-subunit amino acid transport system substrate-binding protein
MIRTLLMISVISGTITWATPFRLAAIYPVAPTAGHKNCTCGEEAACITRAVVNQAKAKGLNIVLTPIDNHRDPREAKAVVSKIVKSEFDAAIGTLESTDALVVSKSLENAEVPFIVPTASHVDITKNRKYVVRVAFNDKRQATLLADLAVRELRAKRILIIHNVSNPYSDFLADEFRRQVEAKAQASVIKVVDGFGGFPDVAQEISKSHPDVVFAPIPQIQLASLYVELLNKDATLTLLTSDVIEKEPRFLPQVKASSKIRFIYPQHWDGKLTGPQAKNYQTLQAKHCSRYQPSMTSVAAYDAAQTLLEVLGKEPTARGQVLVNRIRSHRYNGITGTVPRGADGDPLRALELFELKNGKASYWRRWE